MDETSTATVTFLFSDVESSTALLRKLRDGYGAVMGEHERLLRTAWEGVGGRELDADGDSFFVAFRRPRQAVEAAAAAQRAVAAHSWPEGVELRVRIGIHTGEAAVAGDQYVGLAVHRAARICDAGRELHRLALNAQLDRESRLTRLLDEPAEGLEARLRGERGCRVRMAEDADHPPHLRERLAAGPLDDE